MVNISMSALKDQHPLTDANHPYVQEIEKEDKEAVSEAKLDPRTNQFKNNSSLITKSNTTTHLAQPKKPKAEKKVESIKKEKP